MPGVLVTGLRQRNRAPRSARPRAWLLGVAALLACSGGGTGERNDGGGSTGGTGGGQDARFTCLGPWTPVTGPFSACVYGGRCVSCWGSSLGGFEGFPFRRPALSTAGLVQLPSNVKGLAVGLQYVCALLEDGSVLCGGGDGSGELGDGQGGDGTYNTVTTSQVDLGGVPVETVTGGLDHVCVLRVDGTVWCWGDDVVGELGIGESGNGKNRTSPVEVDLGGAAVKTVVARQQLTCVILTDGTLECWGSNSGIVDGHGLIMPSPTTVPLAGPVADVALGYRACVRLESGPIECWGGSTTYTPPVPVPGLDPSQVVWFGTGSDQSLALLASGALVGWGGNAVGQLGQLTPGPFPDATPIDMGGPVSAASAGDSAYNCAMLASGSLKCWGNDARMQLNLLSGASEATGTYGSTPAALPDVVFE